MSVHHQVTNSSRSMVPLPSESSTVYRRSNASADKGAPSATVSCRNSCRSSEPLPSASKRANALSAAAWRRRMFRSATCCTDRPNGRKTGSRRARRSRSCASFQNARSTSSLDEPCRVTDSDGFSLGGNHQPNQSAKVMPRTSPVRRPSRRTSAFASAKPIGSSSRDMSARSSCTSTTSFLSRSKVAKARWAAACRTSGDSTRQRATRAGSAAAGTVVARRSRTCSVATEMRWASPMRASTTASRTRTCDCTADQG
mmetsp:Transcript_6547/g.21195  ORF Transcript_6547/g.21195 Transcript_6547/m.21195 type:complete len:256 (+) Transcript_6547:626-1393(+)